MDLCAEDVMLIRAAAADDLPAIREIFNHAITTSTASFATLPVDLTNRAAWLADRQKQGFPVLVAVDSGVIGYGAYGTFRVASGYAHTVEHSVYVAEGARGRGVGRALMQALIADARAGGRHVMIGAVDAANPVSLRLHESLGFVETGRLRQVGAKFGRWLDLALVQLVLDDAPRPPG